LEKDLLSLLAKDETLWFRSGMGTLFTIGETGAFLQGFFWGQAEMQEASVL